jgi:hypothetical protein
MKKVKKVLKKDLYKQEKRLKNRLEKEADRLWHIACCKYWGDDCFFKDSPKKSEKHETKVKHCHHYFPKGRYPELRYDIMNGIPCCWPDHYKAEKIDRTMLADIIVTRGKKWYNDLLKKTQVTRYSFETVEYYQKIIKDLNDTDN